jgi:23S rRNA (cytosine1962-C5)-methyltransferase
MSQAVILKPGKEKAAFNRHHWIFSGAVAQMPDFEDGQILPVESSAGQMLGHAYFNRHSGIIGRFVSFGASAPEAAILNHLEEAYKLRQNLFDGSDTTAYRLVNAEGDSLPGLTIDRYEDSLVLQITTLGMEKLKPLILDWLGKNLEPKGIYERSDLSARKEEGMPEYAGWLGPAAETQIDFRENGLKFRADIAVGQKTGFFLDQREMRSLVKSHSRGRKVLNCFAYTGAFGVYALAGGAVRADAVEISENAKELFEYHLQANGFGPDQGNFFAADVFDFLRSDGVAGYDFVILDPPAFAKRKTDIVRAARGYKDINRLAIKNVNPGGLVLTSSCSYFVDEKLFRQVVFQAAAEAGRDVKIIGKHRLAPDHPINIYHPEGEYLKSFLLHVA